MWNVCNRIRMQLLQFKLNVPFTRVAIRQAADSCVIDLCPRQELTRSEEADSVSQDTNTLSGSMGTKPRIYEYYIPTGLSDVHIYYIGDLHMHPGGCEDCHDKIL